MRLIDADELGVGRCSKDVLPAAYCYVPLRTAPYLLP